MKHSFYCTLSALILTTSLSADTSPTYINVGVTNNPQIDAQTVINAGTINASGSLPFETQDTLFFTNQQSGTMTGSPGFRFDLVSPTLGRLPADTFANQGLISASDSGFIVMGGISTVGGVGGSYITVDATNIQAAGLMSVGKLGLLQLTGQAIDLTRCGIRAAAPVNTNLVVSGVRGMADGTNFSNVPGVGDLNASVGTNVTPIASIPPSKGYASYAYTNKVNDSNYIVQVVFVATNNPDTNILTAVKFAPASSAGLMWPGPDPLERSRIAVVQFSLAGMDITTGTPLTNYVYALDTSAFGAVQTNWVLLTNSTGLPNLTTRPAGFEVINTVPREWRTASTNNAIFTNTLLYTKDFATDTVTNQTADYIAVIGVPESQSGVFTSAVIPFSGDGTYLPGLNVPTSDPTNLPGRVEIKADYLDIDQTRIRSEVLTRINAKHLVGLETAQLDVPYLYFDVGSTNGSLVITNLVPNSVRRLTGTVTMSSIVYSNQLLTAVTNAPVDTNNPATPTTNTTDYLFHILKVDNQLVGNQPVSVDQLTVHSTNVVLSDRIVIAKSLLVDADNLRVTGQLGLSGFVNDLDSTQFPHLNTLTNDGTISFPGVGRLGTDRTNAYAQLVNRGVISGNSELIWADQFENMGSINGNAGPISILANVGKLDKGQLNAAGNVELKANEFKVQQSKITADTLLINVTNRFTDSGPASSNMWQCNYGFQLLSTPTNGDLLGTQIKSVAPRFMSVPHLWSGNDFGPTLGGFTNNAALGKLILDGDIFSQFSFAGTGTSNALYVDYLVLTNNATNITNSLLISSNLVLYFAAANVPVESLNGAFSNHIQWVPQFPGPNSSTNITLPNGQKLTVNRSLLTSTNIDSDADGLVNAKDPSPFDGPKLTQLTVTNVPPLTFTVSWRAAAKTVYEVDYSTNLIAPPSWQFLMNYTNSTATNQTATIQDVIPQGAMQRYYRVNYTP